MSRRGRVTFVLMALLVAVLAGWALLTPLARASWPVYSNRVGVIFVDTDNVMKAFICDWESVHKLAVLHRQEVMQVRIYYPQAGGSQPSYCVTLSGHDVYYLRDTLDGIVVSQYDAVPEAATKFHIDFAGKKATRTVMPNKLMKQVGGGARVQLLSYDGSDWDIRSTEAWQFDMSQAVDLDL